MVASTSDAKGTLEVILSRGDDTKDGLGAKFRLLVTMAMLLCSDDDNGACETTSLSAQGGLASSRLRRAKALMMDSLSNQSSITHAARECGFSYSHFIRAFKKSVGVSPRQWLCSHRVDRAKWLLLNTDQSLSEVASACGFSEQCHFTRTFTRLVGMAPGVWRRVFSSNSQLWEDARVTK